MKLSNRQQVEMLSRFRSEDLCTTSFYLDTDKSRLTRKEISLESKNLIRSSRSQLDSLELSKAKKDSLSSKTWKGSNGSALLAAPLLPFQG